MTPGVDFILIPIEESERYAVKFLTGPYTDIVVAFGVIKPTINEENQSVHIDFQYQIIEGSKELQGNKDFEDTCFSFILQSLEQISIENNNLQVQE